VRYQPYIPARTALSPEARQLLARIDPAAPARHDAAVRLARARACLTGRYPTEIPADMRLSKLRFEAQPVEAG